MAFFGSDWDQDDYEFSFFQHWREEPEEAYTIIEYTPKPIQKFKPKIKKPPKDFRTLMKKLKKK